MVDEKLIWNRLKHQAEADIKQYEDALFVSEALVNLADCRLMSLQQRISGMQLIPDGK